MRPTEIKQTVRIPAMSNAHSHAFQIALRGRGERSAPSNSSGTPLSSVTQRSVRRQATAPANAHASEQNRDDFWTWREQMYALATRLDPDSIYELSYRAYCEMHANGYGVVGEFHYVHHQPNGAPYSDPNAMAIAVIEAATAAGIEVVLLPVAYARAGFENGQSLAPSPGQRRFCDESVAAFLTRVDDLCSWADSKTGVNIGVAAHSVRAVPADWLTEIARYSTQNNLIRHIHAHEQRRELRQCEAEHGCSPIELLDRVGFLGAPASIIHGIHVSDTDIKRVAETETTVVTCPTTEGNLGDGYFPALRYRNAGVRITIGSDSNVIIDPFEELRELETGARREGETRHGLLASYGDLWEQVRVNGCSSLGLVADRAPKVEINLDHPRLVGVDTNDLPLALATCASADVVIDRKLATQ